MRAWRESRFRGDGFAARLALFYAATFLVAGAKMPFLPVWLDWRGLTAAEIGIVASVPLFLRIVATPVITYLADAQGNHRGAIILLAWASALVLAALGTAQGFLGILVLTVLLSLAATSVFPLTETVAMAGVRRTGADYGRMRLWGSLSFIVSGFIAGLAVERLGAASILPMLAGWAVLAAIAAHLLPRPARDVGALETARRPIRPADVWTLLATRRFALFLIAVGAVQAAHAVFYTFGVLHWQSQGISPVGASVLWSVGVLTEIALFAWSGAAVRRLGAAGLMLAGAIAAVLRWGAMAFDPPYALLMPLQVLHGLTYGAAHLGAVHFMSAEVPEAQAGTAQGLYASVTAGIAMGLATLLAGWLYPRAGGGAYFAMAALGVVGAAASLLLMRRTA